MLIKEALQPSIKNAVKLFELPGIRGELDPFQIVARFLDCPSSNDLGLF